MKRTLCVVSLTCALLAAGAGTALAQQKACEQVQARLLWLNEKASDDEAYTARLEMLTKDDIEHVFDCLKSTSAEDRERAWNLLADVNISVAIRQQDKYEALVARYNTLVANYDNLLTTVREYVAAASGAKSPPYTLSNFLADVARSMTPPKQLHCTTQHVGRTSYTNCQEY